MLKFTTHESSSGSHFFITTLQENICLLTIQKLDKEEMFFDHDYLQDSVYELTVAKVTGNNENCTKKLAPTIKNIFDSFLEEKEETVVYISVPQDSPKYRLIKLHLTEETNPHIRLLLFKVDNNAFFFFFNEEKTSTIDVIVGLTQYFKLEHGISFINEL